LTLSLHDALPICFRVSARPSQSHVVRRPAAGRRDGRTPQLAALCAGGADRAADRPWRRAARAGRRVDSAVRGEPGAMTAVDSIVRALNERFADATRIVTPRANGVHCELSPVSINRLAD